MGSSAERYSQKQAKRSLDFYTYINYDETVMSQNPNNHIFTKPHQPIAFSEVFKFVWSYFSRFPLTVILAYFAITISSIADILSPILINWLIDTITIANIAEAERFKQALFIVFVIFGQSLVLHSSYRIAHFLNCYTDSQVERLVAAEIHDRVQRFSTDWHANSFAGATVTKIRRAMRAVHSFFDIFCYDIYHTATILAGLIIITTLKQPLLGLIFGLFSVIYVILSLIMVFYFVVPANRESNRCDNRLGATLADTIAGNEIVKAFAGEKREEEHFKKISTQWMLAARNAWMRGNIVAMLKNILMAIVKLLVLGGAVWFWHQGDFTPGDVVFVFSGYFILSGYLRPVTDRIRELNQSINDMEDVIHFIKTPIGIIDIHNAQKLAVKKGKIEFKNISFCYPNQPKPIFDNFSLTIRAKEKIALVGHSGSGKTTLAKLLQRLYNLQIGKILIDNQDIAKVTQNSLRQNIALVPQDPALFHRSLLENITYARPNASKKELEEAVKKAHIDEFIQSLPSGYQTFVGERGIKLSGGQRQRVAIARALLADYPILIMDEATSSLDSKSEKLIQDAIANLLKQRTAIIIAHRLSTIKFVDRIIVLDNGKIAEVGTHSALVRKTNGIYKKLFELQASGFLGE